LKNEVLNDYIINGKIDIDKIIDDFYGYVYIIVKNGVSISITNEDIEEIMSDVIAKILNYSTSNVKTILHRVRKIIKRNLEDGGYSYGK
jgi:hypothetical protein